MGISDILMPKLRIQNIVLRTIYFRSLFPKIFLLYYIFYVWTDALYNNLYYFNKESKFFNPYYISPDWKCLYYFRTAKNISMVFHMDKV